MSIGILNNILLRTYPEFEWHMVGNWFCFGIPFFFTGVFIEIKYKIKESQVINVMMIAAIVLGVAESLWLRMPGGIMGFLVLPIIIFLWCLCEHDVEVKWIEKIGKKYSLYIYLVHPAIQLIVTYIERVYELSAVWIWIKPIFVVSLSLIFSYYVVEVKRELEKMRIKER